MPHIEMGLGTQTGTTTDFQTARQLIPGVEPGGSRVGRPLKPALLLLDAWLEVVDMDLLGLAVDYNQMLVFLKLSQEPTMNPGLILPVATVGMQRAEVTAVGEMTVAPTVIDIFRAKGTVWAPRFLAIGLTESGSASLNANLHLDYEQIDIPWVEWFVKWDFLDHIVDNTRDY